MSAHQLQSLLRLTACWTLLTVPLFSALAGDIVRLRTGEDLQGSILRESTAEYIFNPSEDSIPMQRIPRDAAAY